MSRKSIATFVVILVVVAALAVSGVVMAKKPKPGGCPWSDIQCPDVYDPVTCDGGVTYPNACYAFAACATGCGAGGAGI